MTTPAIQFIYSFDFPDKPETLHGVTELYEIASLRDWATKTANNLLAGCLGSEAKLKQFFAFDRFPPVFNGSLMS